MTQSGNCRARSRCAGFDTSATGIFDAATRAALIAFQKSAGLAADGIAGPKTWAALRKAAETPQAEPNWLLAFLHFIAGLFGWRKCVRDWSGQAPRA